MHSFIHSFIHSFVHSFTHSFNHESSTRSFTLSIHSFVSFIHSPFCTQLTQYVVTRYYRAPELLCDSPYDERIDVWSAGLIFAEIMVRRVVLRGSNYMDQLHKTVELVGVPSEADCSFIADPAARKTVTKMTSRASKRLESVLSTCTPLAHDLVRKMLTFDPRKRITVTEALAHPFFEPVSGVEEWSGVIGGGVCSLLQYLSLSVCVSAVCLSVSLCCVFVCLCRAGEWSGVE